MIQHPQRTLVVNALHMEVQGPFIHQYMGLDRAKHEEHEGLINDDRFAKGVQNVIIFVCYELTIKVTD